MKQLINDNGSIESHDYFRIEKFNTKLKIICTVSKDLNENSFKQSAWDSIDSVKNLESGKVTDIKRRDLFKKKPYIN